MNTTTLVILLVIVILIAYMITLYNRLISLKTLFAVAEAYPELKANQNFLNLQEELSDIENKLAAARRYFNSATKDYNIAVQQFPSVIIARMAGFTTYEYFEIDNQEEKNTPNVEF